MKTIIQPLVREKKVLSAILFLLPVFTLSCIHRPITYGTPDMERFKKSVYSRSLTDSIEHKALTPGMPYFVSREVFMNCNGDTAIPVASTGSRQKLDEREGLFSHFHDPGIEVYLDRYQTDRGTLCIWYGNPTFYRFNVMAKDTMVAFGQDGTDTARILYLLKSFSLRLEKSTRASAIPYAEIHHREQNGQISFWYNLAMVDSTTIKLNPQKKSEYPIFRLELDNKEITSFTWK